LPTGSGRARTASSRPHGGDALVVEGEPVEECGVAPWRRQSRIPASPISPPVRIDLAMTGGRRRIPRRLALDDKRVGAMADGLDAVRALPTRSAR